MKVQKVILQNKPVGMTPLEVIKDFKNKNPGYRQEVISYAGRLDPMAEGLLLLLIGDENKNRKKYEDLTKTYETEIVFGIKTDTFDALGLVEKVSFEKPEIEDVENTVRSFIGEKEQEYPPYSSKTVMGKPLYWWARRGGLTEIKIPKRKVEIYNIKILDAHELAVKDIVFDIQERIEKVKGDFRQEEIVKVWEKFGHKNKEKSLLTASFRIECSSGTYIRRLASDLGECLNCGAFCLSIKRTRVGAFELKDIK